MRAADDVLAVGRHRHRLDTSLGVRREGVDERAVDVVQPDLAGDADSQADHKVHAVGQRRDAAPSIAHLEGALESAVERPQLASRHGRGDADEAPRRPAAPPPALHQPSWCAPGWCARTRRRATP